MAKERLSATVSGICGELDNKKPAPKGGFFITQFSTDFDYRRRKPFFGY